MSVVMHPLRALLGVGAPVGLDGEGVAELAVTGRADGAGSTGESALARPADGASLPRGTFGKSCVKSNSYLRHL